MASQELEQAALQWWGLVDWPSFVETSPILLVIQS
jgi:hypothetical protein